MRIDGTTVVGEAMKAYQYRNGEKRGLGELMRRLSPEQREEISGLLQNLPADTRKQVKEELLSLDLAQEDLYSKAVEIISAYTSNQVSSGESNIDILA